MRSGKGTKPGAVSYLKLGEEKHTCKLAMKRQGRTIKVKRTYLDAKTCSAPCDLMDIFLKLYVQ